jgi:electron transfer flavoprotein beta subunit
MKIIVPIKRVIDYNVKVRPKMDGSAVELDNVKMAMNPFDEIAVEEALRLKEAGKANEVIVLSIGSHKSQDILRAALAMGADRAILIETDLELEPLHIAKLIKNRVEEEKPGLIILGKQSIDGDNNQTGQMLAALLNYPQATFASKVILENEQAQVTREVDGGLETISIRLPAIITTDLRLNQPRYVALPNIMKARQKPLHIIPAADLGIEFNRHVSILKVEAPSIRKAGIKLNSVSELVEKLKNDGVI